MPDPMQGLLLKLRSLKYSEHQCRTGLRCCSDCRMTKLGRCCSDHECVKFDFFEEGFIATGYGSAICPHSRAAVGAMEQQSRNHSLSDSCNSTRIGRSL